MSCKVSVIIPVYNCIKYLEKAVNSVLLQTRSEIIEIILVDDGSTDGSAELCESLAEKHECISVIHQKNSGVSVARNRGIEASKGEYIAFLDSDDEYEPDFIAEMVDSFDSDLICCDYFLKNIGERHLGKIFENRMYLNDDFNFDFWLCTIREEFYSCWDKLYRKEILMQNGIRFFPGVKYGEDMEFVFEYLKHCHSFRFIDKSLYHYNINPDNTTSVVKNGLDVWHAIYVYQSEYFKDMPFESEIDAYITDNYIFKTTCTVNSRITYDGVWNAYRYVKRVLSSDFYALYRKKDYSEFKCIYDRVFFRLLKRRMAFAIVLWRKLFDLRSKLFHD